MAYFFSRLLVHRRNIWQHRWLARAAAWGVAGLGLMAVFPLLVQSHSAALVDVDTLSMLEPLLSSMATAPNVSSRCRS